MLSDHKTGAFVTRFFFYTSSSTDNPKEATVKAIPVNGTVNGSVSCPWPEEATTRVPYQVFLDPAIYTQEQERIFRGPIWSYVALEAEVPNPQDFKATFIGDTPIVVTRDKEGALHAFVNRCA